MEQIRFQGQNHHLYPFSTELFHLLLKFVLLCHTERRRREETSEFFDSLNSDDLPTMVTSHREGNLPSSSRHRSGSDLTNIRPKLANQETLQPVTGKSKSQGSLSTNQGLMSPFKTFLLPEEDSLFESDPSAWADISSFDKTANRGKNLPLSKLTSPGTTGKVLSSEVVTRHCYFSNQGR